MGADGVRIEFERWAVIVKRMALNTRGQGCVLRTSAWSKRSLGAA